MDRDSLIAAVCSRLRSTYPATIEGLMQAQADLEHLHSSSDEQLVQLAEQWGDVSCDLEAGFVVKG